MLENYNEFQVGNWVIYRPEGNYCIIKSLIPELILEGSLHHYSGTIELIEKIKITEDKLQVCGFYVQYPRITKKFSDEISVTLILLSEEIYKFYKNDEEFCNVKFIHEVQNAYHQITGDILQGNLYGVREN